MPSHNPVSCPHCHKLANIQLVYDVSQVAHLLNISPGSVNWLLSTGKLKFRYRLRSGVSVRRVVDYFQLWDYILSELPTPEDLESEGINRTARAIRKIQAWHRAGGRKAGGRKKKTDD